jgi:pimeloyl-ACP methyl ester carboxylesterase
MTGLALVGLQAADIVGHSAHAATPKHFSHGAKRTYVLVHGAWFGGWVWRFVAPRLRAMGHEVWSPTLTGLGERKHLDAGGYDLTTHIEDVVAMIEMEDLRDIHLVGWSYGGMVVTGVLDRISDRIKSMVYLDAFTPENGQSLADFLEPDIVKVLNDAKGTALRLQPIPMSALGLSDPKLVAFAEKRVAPQFWKTFTTPVQMQHRPKIPFSYIRYSKYKSSVFDKARDHFKAIGFATYTLDAGHVGMLDNVDLTVDALLKVD